MIGIFRNLLVFFEFCNSSHIPGVIYMTMCWSFSMYLLPIVTLLSRLSRFSLPTVYLGLIIISASIVCVIPICVLTNTAQKRNVIRNDSTYQSIWYKMLTVGFLLGGILLVFVTI